MIWKFPLRLEPGTQVLRMPGFPKPLTVQMQFGAPVLWALVDPNVSLRDARVTCVYTGQPAPFGADYVGTVQHDGLVHHYFLGR